MSCDETDGGIDIYPDITNPQQQFLNLYPSGKRPIAPVFNNFWADPVQSPCASMVPQHINSAAYFASSAVCPRRAYVYAAQGAMMSQPASTVVYPGGLATAGVRMPVAPAAQNAAAVLNSPVSSCSARAQAMQTIRRAPCYGSNNRFNKAVVRGKTGWEAYAINCQ